MTCTLFQARTAIAITLSPPLLSLSLSLSLCVFRLHDEGNAVDIVRLLDDPGGADASEEDVGGVAQVVVLLDLVDLVEVPGNEEGGDVGRRGGKER